MIEFKSFLWQNHIKQQLYRKTMGTLNYTSNVSGNNPLLGILNLVSAKIHRRASKNGIVLPGAAKANTVFQRVLDFLKLIVYT